MLHYRNIVEIIQLVAYIPCLIIAVIVAFRHGFGRSSGWIFLVIFSLIRLVGSITSLLTMYPNDSIALYITAAVCESIGLSPLLMSSIGLLSRVNDSIARKSRKELQPMVFRLLSMLTLAGLILFIIGATSNTTPEGLTQINSKTKIGMDIFIATFLLLCLLLLVLATRRRQIEDGEHRLLAAVAISMPLLLVRLIYSILVIYVHSSTWNQLTGNVTAMLIMSVLTELVIVGIYLGTGLTLHTHLTDVQYEAPSEASMPLKPYQNGPPMFANRPAPNTAYDPRIPMTDYDHDPEYNAPAWNNRRQRRQRRGGPIHMLIGMAVDATKSSGQRY